MAVGFPRSVRSCYDSRRTKHAVSVHIGLFLLLEGAMEGFDEFAFLVGEEVTVNLLVIQRRIRDRLLETLARELVELSVIIKHLIVLRGY